MIFLKTGGHDDVFAFNRGFFAFVIHFQLPEITVFAHERGSAEQAGYFVFLKQEFNPAGELGDDAVFTLDHLGGNEFSYKSSFNAVYPLKVIQLR